MMALLAACAGLWAWQFAQRTKPNSSAESRDKLSVAGHEIESDAAAFNKYAGSKSCRACHQQAFIAWTNSHHALAERLTDSSLDRTAFEPPRSFQHGSQTSEARSSGNRFEIVTHGLVQERKAFSVERVIGVAPLRQFLISAPGGRFQVSELAFDPSHGDWFDIFGNEDRQPGEWGQWTGRGMTWNTMCAACHNTRLRKNYRETDETYATAMAERGVGCEACHGPMADHVVWQRKFSRAKGDPTIHRLDRNQTLATCGSCHSRRAELTGDFAPGENFADHFALTIPDDTDVYYPDGQIHDEDYEYTSFLSSKMNLAGVRCADCHDPHSSKTIAVGNALCMRCHGAPIPPAPKIEPAAHSHHRADESGGRCVDCHMPQTVYMQRHARHDHGFTIPDPLLTKQHNIPNACNRCHADRSVDWVLEAVEKWYGTKMERPSRARAQIITEARAGKNSAMDGLMNIAREEKNPLWRAVATGLLRRWCQETNVTNRLLEKTADPDPLVRATAARSLEPLMPLQIPNVHASMVRLLQDSARSVRIEAAWVLHSEIELQSVAGSELTRYLEHNSDQPSGAFQLGVFHLDRNENEVALNYFRRAVNWDSHSAPFHDALAVALSAQGKMDDVVQELETACRLAPREAEYRYKLALALNELGKLNEATAALEETVKLDPQFSRAWYNLGLAYSQNGQPSRALDALIRAESIDALSARIPYARATILARLGRNREASIEARRALEIDPGFSDAAALLQSLETEK